MGKSVTCCFRTSSVFVAGTSFFQKDSGLIWPIELVKSKQSAEVLLKDQERFLEVKLWNSTIARPPPITTFLLCLAGQTPDSCLRPLVQKPHKRHTTGLFQRWWLRILGLPRMCEVQTSWHMRRSWMPNSHNDITNPVNRWALIPSDSHGYRRFVVSTWQENIWGLFNQLTARDSELLRRAATILRWAGRQNFTHDFEAWHRVDHEVERFRNPDKINQKRNVYVGTGKTVKLTVPGVGSPCPRGRSFGALGSNGCALCTDSRHIQTPSIRILESPSNLIDLIEPSVYSQLSGLGLAKNWKMFWHVLTTTRYNPAPTFHLFTARSVQTRLSGYTRGSAMFQKSNISCFHVGRLCLLHVGPVGFFGRSKTCWLPWDKLRLIEIQIYIGNY